MKCCKEISHEERTKLKEVRHETAAIKFEAEEVYQLAHLGFRVSKDKSWIPEQIKTDIKQIGKGIVPIHLEVIARITASSFLAYVLALGSFPNVIPESQRVLIAMLGPTLGMIFPTLIFSVGLIMFPQLIFVTLLGLVLATMLLACAAGVSLGFYVFVFGCTALVISGMRFDKKTGGMTCFLVIEMALNSQPLAPVAEELGMDFVKSLWTETGVTNPKALYSNTIVGMLWIVFVVMVGRILPPFRTARTGIKGLLQASLKSAADYIELNAEVLRHRLLESQGVSEGDGTEPQDLEERRNQLMAKLIHNKSVLTNGHIAGLTAFEPRMFRFGPPECDWKVLEALCLAVDRTVLSSLAVGAAWADPQALSIQLEQQLIPNYDEAAALLRKCAKAIMSNSTVEVEEGTSREKPEPSVHDEYGLDSIAVDPINSTVEVEEGASQEEPEPSVDDEYGLDSITVDPLFLKSVCYEVVTAANDWAELTGPPDRTKPFFDEKARMAMKLNLLPWLKGPTSYLRSLVNRCCAALRPSTWRSLVLPPYNDLDKVGWCIDFTVGFTVLVAMGVFWDEFRRLDNETWFLIAYAFSTTQTAEGTVKKGVLRLLGTVAGGFSGWLAVTVCGEDNIYGLIAWLTVFTAVASYIGLPRGFKSRLGLSHDYGHGPFYFVMTQALVVAQVYLKLADKRTVTFNRMATNAIGIAVAIVLALLPPGLYGGNPKYTKRVLEEEKSLLVECINLLLSHTQSTDIDATSSKKIEDEIQTIRSERITKISKLIEEANDFYSDSAKLRSFHLLNVDSQLKECLDKLQVMASWIFVSVGYAVKTLKDKRLGDQFLDDAESRLQLQKMIEELEAGSGEVHFEKLTIEDADSSTTSAVAKSRIFINCIVISIHKLEEVDEKLRSIKYGLCS